jgi:hypothetical protein
VPLLVPAELPEELRGLGDRRSFGMGTGVGEVTSAVITGLEAIRAPQNRQKRAASGTTCPHD